MCVCVCGTVLSLGRFGHIFYVKSVVWMEGPERPLGRTNLIEGVSKVCDPPARLRLGHSYVFVFLSRCLFVGYKLRFD